MKLSHKKFDGDLLLTTACRIECEFCIYGCTPKGEWMSQETIRKVAEEYTKNDIGIRICGGEPFYDLKKLKKCLDIILKHQEPHQISIITSGFFGENNELIKESIMLLKENKIDSLVLSIDRFHLKKLSYDSLINIIQESKSQGINIILRLSTDEKSYEVMDNVAEIIVKYNIKVEPHYTYGIYGKAELLDSKLLNFSDKRKKYFINKLSTNITKYKTDKNIDYYITNSPKRSQRMFGKGFFPTTFPNGNVYADSQCCKGSYMGNINNTSLKKMIEDFSKTLPGYIL